MMSMQGGNQDVIIPLRIAAKYGIYDVSPFITGEKHVAKGDVQGQLFIMQNRAESQCRQPNSTPFESRVSNASCRRVHTQYDHHTSQNTGRATAGHCPQRTAASAVHSLQDELNHHDGSWHDSDDVGLYPGRGINFCGYQSEDSESDYEDDTYCMDNDSDLYVDLFDHHEDTDISIKHNNDRVTPDYISSGQGNTEEDTGDCSIPIFETDDGEEYTIYKGVHMSFQDYLIQLEEDHAMDEPDSAEEYDLAFRNYVMKHMNDQQGHLADDRTATVQFMHQTQHNEGVHKEANDDEDGNNPKNEDNVPDPCYHDSASIHRNCLDNMHELNLWSDGRTHEKNSYLFHVCTDNEKGKSYLSDSIDIGVTHNQYLEDSYERDAQYGYKDGALIKHTGQIPEHHALEEATGTAKTYCRYLHVDDDLQHEIPLCPGTCVNCRSDVCHYDSTGQNEVSGSPTIVALTSCNDGQSINDHNGQINGEQVPKYDFHDVREELQSQSHMTNTFQGLQCTSGFDTEIEGDLLHDHHHSMTKDKQPSLGHNINHGYDVIKQVSCQSPNRTDMQSCDTVYDRNDHELTTDHRCLQHSNDLSWGNKSSDLYTGPKYIPVTCYISGGTLRGKREESEVEPAPRLTSSDINLLPCRKPSNRVCMEILYNPTHPKHNDSESMFSGEQREQSQIHQDKSARKMKNERASGRILILIRNDSQFCHITDASVPLSPVRPKVPPTDRPPPLQVIYCTLMSVVCYSTADR